MGQDSSRRSRLADSLVRHGYITPEQLEDCLRVQRRLEAGGESVPLDQVLLKQGCVTAEVMRAALRELPRGIRYCARCDAAFHVDLRPDAETYRCGRCREPLSEPAPGWTGRAIDESIIVETRSPVPQEVDLARKNPTRCFGKYVLLEEVGRGGLGVVYRAWDTYMNHVFALKRLREIPQGPSMEARVSSLLNEAHNAIALRHPNIVSVYDVGRIAGEYYITMEYVQGRTMLQEASASRKAGSVSPYHDDPRRWLSVMYQVAHAVHFAHSQPKPILHLDLKPGNIIVTPDNRACVLDFGLAACLGELKGQQDHIAGTPAYMSPEQASGRSGDFAPTTDVYALGVILYELLTGRPPFTDIDVRQLLPRILKEHPRPPSEISWVRERSARMKLIPPELESLCLRCIEKDPVNRPATALVVAQAIASISAAGRTATVRAPTAPPELPRAPAVRRGGTPLLLAGLTAIILALVVAGIALVRPSGSRPQAPTAAAAALLAKFRPERIDARAAVQQDGELGWRVLAVAGFKERLLRAIGERKPVMPELRAGGRTWTNARLWKGHADYLLFVTQEPDVVSWDELGPDAIVKVSYACGAFAPADRIALAVYCIAAEAWGPAATLLKSLEEGEFAARARAYEKLLPR